MYNSLQLREIFHLEFMRRFSRTIKKGKYAIKGGTNLRFFYQSFRYSEDMDIDISGLDIMTLKESVMKILELSSFQDSLRPFGINRIVPPDIAKAKQTETTQRFKIHILNSAGEDLFTKIEFSRRGFKGKIAVEPVRDTILRPYKMLPLLLSHYDVKSAIIQKINALATRTVIQARDIFDLYILKTQISGSEICKIKTSAIDIKKASKNIFEIGFEQFRDTVLLYLSDEDRAEYNSGSNWDEMKLSTAILLDEIGKRIKK